MRQPRLCPGLAVERGALDVNVLVGGVETFALDGCLVSCDGVLEADLLHEWRVNEVHVLAGNGE